MELVINQPLDLAASLESGQAHRWRKQEEWYSGVVRGNFIKIRQTQPEAEAPSLYSPLAKGQPSYPPLSKGGIGGGGRLEFCSEPRPETSVVALLQSYFRLDDDISAIYADICRDERVAAMVARYPGLRVLRQEPWECLIAFICSANSNIPRIAQTMEKLASHYGNSIQMEGEVRHAFPTPQQLAAAGEAELRKLGLGFRAPYVAKAALRVAQGELDLESLIKLPYAEAKARLIECAGIGPKVSDCIAVFSLEKLEAFPIDVWVRRALGEWYFPGQKVPPDRILLEWAHQHFGRYAGYAQQYLFHGRRMEH